MTWVLGMMKKEGKKITRQDMEDFLEKTGTDMGNISQELEKLLSYTMGRWTAYEGAACKASFRETGHSSFG